MGDIYNTELPRNIFDVIKTRHANLMLMKSSMKFSMLMKSSIWKKCANFVPNNVYVVGPLLCSDATLNFPKTVKTRSRQTHIPIVSKLRDDMSPGNSSSSRQTFQFNSIKYAQKINQNYTFIFCAFFLATFCHIVAIWVQLLVQFSSAQFDRLFVCLFVRSDSCGVLS